MDDPQSLPRTGRAEHYRRQADKLRVIAAGAVHGVLRDQLIKLAGEYDGLAKSIETGRR